MEIKRRQKLLKSHPLIILGKNKKWGFRPPFLFCKKYIINKYVSKITHAIMFIKITAERRININSILEYKPEERDTISNKRYYYIKFKLIDGVEEEMTFFANKEKRDKLLKILDDNFLTNET